MWSFIKLVSNKMAVFVPSETLHLKKGVKMDRSNSVDDWRNLLNVQDIDLYPVSTSCFFLHDLQGRTDPDLKLHLVRLFNSALVVATASFRISRFINYTYVLEISVCSKSIFELFSSVAWNLAYKTLKCHVSLCVKELWIGLSVSFWCFCRVLNYCINNSTT